MAVVLLGRRGSCAERLRTQKSEATCRVRVLLFYYTFFKELAKKLIADTVCCAHVIKKYCEQPRN